MDFHPFAAKFPLIDGAEWDAFKASIRETKGNEEPIVYRMVNGQKQGLDGRNRLRACEELGIEPTFKKVFLEDSDVKPFIVRRNVHRRHMTPELRREIVAELRADGQSTRKIAAAVGVSHTTVENDLKSSVGKILPTESKPASQPVQPAKVTGTDGKQYQATKPKPPEREPGDDSEEMAAESKANREARARNGKPVFDDRQITDTLGKLTKLWNERQKAVGASAASKAMHAAIDGVFDAWKAWQKGGHK